MNQFLDTVVVCPLTSVLHPRWRGRRPIHCAGKDAEVAVDQIRTISKQRLKKQLDSLSAEESAQTPTPYYGDVRGIAIGGGAPERSFEREARLVADFAEGPESDQGYEPDSCRNAL